jgi:hypothetical protein
MTTSSNVAGDAPDARVDAEMASRSDPRYPRTFTEVFGACQFAVEHQN